MITFKLIIIPNNRRKDGTYPVKIRVTFKGVTRRLPTTLVCKSTDLTRGNRIKNADILTRGEELINRMRGAVKDLSPFDLEDKDVDWVVSRIKERLSENSFRLDFFSWCDKYIQTKTKPTQSAYISAINALERYLGKRELDINDITKSLLLEFVDFVDNEPKMRRDPHNGKFYPCKFDKIPKASSSRHLMKLQHMYNSAKDRFNDEDSGRIVIPRSPFNSITKVFPPSNGQKNLGQELMQRIISAQTDDPTIRHALDAFVVSFGLMGANLADLYLAIPVTGTWVYNRQKTKTRRADRAETHVEIPEVLEPYIKRLQEGEDQSGWWLPVLHRMANSQNLCTARINRALKRWCERNEIPVFTFYAGRHTWASLARKCGIEKATIDDCLVHKGTFDVTDIYAEKSWDLMTEANRKVLDLFEW